MRRRLQPLTLGAALLGLLSVASVVLPTTLLHRNLKAMIDISQRIFVGRCVSAQEGELVLARGKINYTEYTFEVRESLKGDVGKTITFRQHGLMQSRQVGENLILYDRVAAMPVYSEGHDYLLFLIGDSKLGLTSPVGLYQGAFRIKQDQFGREMALNGIENRGLFKDLNIQELSSRPLTESEHRIVGKSSGPFVLDDFVSLVKEIVK